MILQHVTGYPKLDVYGFQHHIDRDSGCLEEDHNISISYGMVVKIRTS